ncbi:hypothetical protein FS837_005893 [Tulasnella sp. UAMH 9824]|nr:hypothetical protein FS837_005893 [Tulasnella sp. UAMH 9824]
MVRHSIALLVAISTIRTVPPVNADFHLPQSNPHHHRRGQHALIQIQRDIVLPSGWTYIGCRGEPSDGPMLPVKLSTGTVSPGLCTTACNSAGFTAAGMQYGSECWCGYYDQLNSPTTLDESHCSMTCSGDISLKCGNSYVNSLYARSSDASSSSSSSRSNTTSRSASLTASFAPAPSGWTNLGCYVDQADRTLTGASRLGWSDMTPALCAANCAGYTYFGTEYGNECYCGNALTNNVPTPVSECDFNCAGDASQKCGGGWRLTLYQAAWTNLGCYVDQPARTLNGASKIDNAMTVGMCQTFCSGSGFTYAGVENNVECYCGNTLTVNSPAPSTDCQAPCGGDATQICGGSLNWRMTIYKYTSPTPLPTYTSVGCFVDSSSRVLPTPAPTGTAVTYTAQTCGTYCASLSLPYAGVEKAGAQCFCSDRMVLSNTGGALVNPTECPGSWRIAVYYNVLFDSGSCSNFS